MRPAGLFVATLATASTCAPLPPALPAERPPPTEVWLDRDEVARAGIAIAVAEMHDVSDVLVTPGRVAFDENRVSHILSPVSGQVRTIDGRLGAHVAKGHTLAVIASPDLGQATSDLDKARASLISAEHAYARQREMWPARATTLSDLEQAEDDLNSARAEQARATQKVALFHAGRAVTQAYDLKSPIAGEILAREVNPGLQVQGIYDGGTSPELFTVGDLDEVWVFSAVHEAEFARVHAGVNAEISVIRGDRPYAGFVDWVSGSLDPQTRTASLRCVISNRDEQLKPEMFGTVTVTATPIRALAIPRQALLHLGGATIVFFDRGLAPDARTRYERLPVTADEDIRGDYVPVTQGVELGDHVVTHGIAALAAKM
jgi:cobalt-zinc-cadmium efflux system membrane fusion protein